MGSINDKHLPRAITIPDEPMQPSFALVARRDLGLRIGGREEVQAQLTSESVRLAMYRQEFVD